jgi:hypothetical protein
LPIHDALEVAAHMASSVRAHTRSPAVPLELNDDDEMSVLLSLAGPIDQQRRPQFLQ